MYHKTTVIVSRVIEYRGDLVIVADSAGVMAFNRNYYRIIKESGEEV